MHERMLMKQATSGSGTSSGGGSGSTALYVDEVFSTYLYDGTGSSQTITNNIDLAGNGGMVWVKARSSSAVETQNLHCLVDTLRGSRNALSSSETVAVRTPSAVSGFTSSGFNLDNSSVGFSAGDLGNVSGLSYASWSFRRAPKFFDIVTYTGTGTIRTVPHALGIQPGCIIIKETSNSGAFTVYHRSAGNNSCGSLNSSVAFSSDTSYLDSTSPTDLIFTLGVSDKVNKVGATYVAYLFAHDAAADGFIQCGTYSGGYSEQDVTLGWEPQWVLIKSSNANPGWGIFDAMRGLTLVEDSPLQANSSASEAGTNSYDYIDPTPTGFRVKPGQGLVGAGTGINYVYIAIRRPMKPPTAGGQVFSPVASSIASGTPYETGFPVDLIISRSTSSGSTYVGNRFSGNKRTQFISSDAENSSSIPYWYFDKSTGMMASSYTSSTQAVISWNIRRAPTFLDQIAYTGTGVVRSINHGLRATPEIILIKRRDSGSTPWYIYHKDFGYTKFFTVNTNAAVATTSSGLFGPANPNSTTINLGASTGSNASGGLYNAYLFASCPGVSKIGSYTGNGGSQTIDCGFSNGARFFLVKRADSTGNWWVWDSTRGITTPTDPVVDLNSGNAQINTADAVDPNSSGIIVNQEANCSINANGAIYIYLAIA